MVESSKEPARFKDFEHDGWEAVSSGYESVFVKLTSQSVPHLLDAADVSSGKSVLDVCTGPGIVAIAASERDADVVGVDFSRAAIDIARAGSSGVDFRVADAEDLPFESSTFDSVTCGFGIIHLPSPEIALNEMHRVLKDDGCVAISTWCAPDGDNGFGKVFESIRSFGDMSVDIPHGPDFFQFGSTERLASALESCGFASSSVSKVEQFWEFEKNTDLLDALLAGGVRVRALLEAQSPDALRRIAESIGEAMSEYATGDGGYRVPMPALVASGKR